MTIFTALLLVTGQFLQVLQVQYRVKFCTVVVLLF